MVSKNLRDDEYLLYVAICMVGLPVEVQVNDGSLYSGILHIDSFDKNRAPSPNSWESNFMWSYDNPFLSDTIEVETVDRAGTFLGSLWESKTNMVVALLQAGLAKLQNSFASVRILDAHLLARAEQSAIHQRLKVNY
ncbi:uncharacterized protein A4U43_C10F13070 [Asparagus officinalis]|uniref:TNase-like domain-containing protein n=1 Tax=Asparagus officinalis TaxID=4686 RepID=A0A5P1E5M1_ASPOF|nr:uncharacterized protein A4U43_C10F13070 [Asparagus officinalis]